MNGNIHYDNPLPEILRYYSLILYTLRFTHQECGMDKKIILKKFKEQKSLLHS